jgi:predicted GNAT family N-acyltransferase
LFDIDDAERMHMACDIRVRVFVDEQHVPLEEEMDEHDRTDRNALHALVYGPGHDPIGTGRFFISEPGTALVGRVAVLAPNRGTGAGAALIDALLAEARRRGLTRAHLFAQVDARGFYLKWGFYDDGEQLWDAGILHQPMSLALSALG